MYLRTKFGCDRSIVAGCRSRNDRQTSRQTSWNNNKAHSLRDVTQYLRPLLRVDGVIIIILAVFDSRCTISNLFTVTMRPLHCNFIRATTVYESVTQKFHVTSLILSVVYVLAVDHTDGRSLVNANLVYCVLQSVNNILLNDARMHCAAIYFEVPVARCSGDTKF